MNLDDLKTPWQAMQRECDTSHIDEISSRVGSRMTRFDHTIRRRDMVENLAAVIVIIGFVISLFYCDDWLTFIGAAIVVVGAIEIVVVLNATRMYHPTPAGLPPVEHCKLEAAKVDRQIFLLRNVHWWYVGPLMLGCCVMSFGADSLIASVVLCGVYIAMGVFVYWINQRAVARHLLPLREELTSAIETFNGNLVDNQTGEIK